MDLNSQTSQENLLRDIANVTLLQLQSPEAWAWVVDLWGSWNLGDFFFLVARKVRENTELRIWVWGIWLLGNKFLYFCCFKLCLMNNLFIIFFCDYLMQLKMLRIVWIELLYYVDIATYCLRIQSQCQPTMGEVQEGLEQIANGDFFFFFLPG